MVSSRHYLFSSEVNEIMVTLRILYSISFILMINNGFSSGHMLGLVQFKWNSVHMNMDCPNYPIGHVSRLVLIPHCVRS